jgi:hypothetical protein
LHSQSGIRQDDARRRHDIIIRRRDLTNVIIAIIVFHPQRLHHRGMKDVHQR